MKKSISIILAVMVLLTSLTLLPISAGAKEYTHGKYTYRITKKGTVCILYCDNKKSQKTFKFPSKIKGKKVTAIDAEGSPFGNGGNIFHYRNSVKKIIIPKNVTRIDNCAFDGCEKLKEISFPSTLKCIGLGAFANCNSLTSVKLPKSLTKLEGAFMSCEKLKSVTLPSKLKVISWESFFSCTSLKTITIPDSVKSIGSLKNIMNAVDFGYCKNLRKVTIGKKVKTIGMQTFLGCKKLKSVVIPASVKEIGKQAFGYVNPYGKKVKGFTIYGKKNSAAHEYAKKNKFKFKKI